MEEKGKVQENKMGVMPENKLLISMAVPMMLSMLVQALYNVVDSIFVSRISEDALTAVSLAFPVQNLMIAFGAGTGVGINALLSKSLGEKNQKLANKTAHNGIFLMIMTSIACALFGIFGSHWFFTTQTDDVSIIEYGHQYLSIVMTFSFGLYGQFVTERLLQATGRTFHTMITQGLGAIINIILDPILIFGMFGLPALGMTGAAVATIIGQIIAAILGVWFNIKKNPDIQLSVKEIKPDKEVVKKVYSVGIPSIIMGSIGSVMTFSFGLYGQFVTERLLQATGRTLYTMFTQGLGAIINIILDPILIFGMFGLPAMGMTGAAVATIIGQIIAAILGVWFNVKKNPDIQLKIKEIKPDKEVIKKVYSVGVPSIIMGSIGSVMTYGMNKILMGFSSTAAAVFGVYFKLQSFFFMPVFGLNNGMVPIIAYNYGARRKDRMMKTLRLSITYAVSIMIVGFLVMQVFPAQLFSLFEASEEMLAIGVPALRTISFSFLFAGYCIIVGSMFQALGNGILSMIVSIARQLVVLLPVAFLLSLTGNVNLIWLSFPIAEIASLVLSSIFLYRIYKKVIKPL